MNKIYLDELETKGNELINCSKNDIISKITKLYNIPRKIIWEGQAHDAFLEEYMNKIKMLNEFNNNLKKLSSFLLEAKNNYDEANEKIDHSYEEMIEELKKKGIMSNGV